jgi:phosphoglycerate dehydrogenase-like enzyme
MVRLINASRGPIVVQAALIWALRTRRIAAALAVFDAEPLPADHPFRKPDYVLTTPHIGYATQDLYRTFDGDAASITGLLNVNAPATPDRSYSNRPAEDNLCNRFKPTTLLRIAI